MKRIKRIFFKLLDIVKKDEMKILPAHLAFFLVLSVVPIITLFGFIASFFSISLDSVVGAMESGLPKEVTEILLPFITGKGIDINIGISMIAVFIIASNGAHSIIVASNTLYNIPNSDYLKRRIKAFFMTILLVLLFLFILIVLAFGNYIVAAILNLDIFRSISDTVYTLFIFLKWPIAYFLILFSLKIIFTVAPDKRIPSKFVNKGVQFTTFGWILVTAIYSYYVSHFANYDIFYGGLSNIIILMMWIYILAYILVLGIAINTNIYNIDIEDKKLPENTSDENK